MADEILCDEIIISLVEHGPIKVESVSDFKKKAGLNDEWSNSKVKRALGSLIHRGIVERCKLGPQSLSDNSQPVYFSLVRV